MGSSYIELPSELLKRTISGAMSPAKTTMKRVSNLRWLLFYVN